MTENGGENGATKKHTKNGVWESFWTILAPIWAPFWVKNGRKNETEKEVEKGRLKIRFFWGFGSIYALGGESVQGQADEAGTLDVDFEEVRRS